jgi:hypothetical protein
MRLTPPTLRASAILTAILLLSGVGACRRDPVFREMSDSTYVKTMVSLRKLPLNIDSASRARQRDSVLRTFGVTAKELEEIAVRLAEDPARASVVFRAIENSAIGAPP